jgi:hypothetical protein
MPAERLLDQVRLALGRLVVRVDQGRLEVTVPEPFLQGPHRDPAAAIRVPNVVLAVVVLTPGGVIEAGGLDRDLIRSVRERFSGGGVSRASVVELRLAEEAVLVDAATVNAEDL